MKIENFGIIAVGVSVIALGVFLFLDSKPKKEVSTPTIPCESPEFVQAVGHFSTTSYIFRCKDGRFVELTTEPVLGVNEVR